MFVLIAVTAVVVWIFSRRTVPPEVSFIKVTRETIVSSLSTNGRVEPIEWLPVRAERAGAVAQVLTARGQQVKRGQPLVELDTRVAQAELDRAEATIQEAKTQERVLDEGGRIAERQQVDADLERARLDWDAARKQCDALQRLVAKQAATRLELDNARQAVSQLELRIHALQQHRAALVTGNDKEVAKAKLREAESAAAIAHTNLDLSVIRAPMDGVVYDFDLKAGAYLNAGDPVAKVGKLDRVRVTVYVDEPDVGKVRKDEIVIITWDAMPGHQWKGEVDKLPRKSCSWVRDKWARWAALSRTPIGTCCPMRRSTRISRRPSYQAPWFFPKKFFGAKAPRPAFCFWTAITWFGAR